MSDLAFLELGGLAARIADRSLSPVAATQAQLARIAALDGALHSYARVTAEEALAQAEAAQAEIAAGRYRGPLHGVPVAIKDLCWTKDIPTAGGTVVHRDFVPKEDATVVRRLKDAGAIILGKLQMTEGAYSDHHPTVAPPKNPWSAAHWSGISSSGSGVATAAGLCYGALGSDTGGSIRWPCAANGVTGLKPTWGRVSRHGTFELAASLDHIGPIARSAADCAILLQAIAGADPADPTALQSEVPNYSDMAGRGVAGLRIGVDPAWNADVDPDTRKAVEDAAATLRILGATIVETRVPDPAGAIADWFPICAVEAAVAHAATYPSRKADYGAALTAAIEAGHALSAIAYHEACLRRATFRSRVDALFREIDLLLTPVQPFAAPTVAEMDGFVETPDLVGALARYTAPFDMSGHPTITLPGSFTGEGLPVGVQLVGGHLKEATCLAAGVAFQGVTDWHRRRPDVSGEASEASAAG